MTGVGKVSVAIPSWNGRHHLEFCLEALLAQKEPGVEWEVLVLDNGSGDGTVEWVRAHHPWVRLHQSPVNLGFCAGNNRLVEAAEGDAVAFLNNDARPCPEWLGALVEALATAPADVAAVSGKILDWKGERLDFARGVMTFDGHAFQVDFRRPLSQAEIPAAGSELPFACGGNMLVRRDAFRAAGGFDADYFAYLEDVDLGWRLWARGERVLFCPEAAVHHRSMATSDLLGLFNRGFLFERNAFLTAYKNYEDDLWRRLMPAILLTLVSRTQALTVAGNPGGELLAVDPYAGTIANTAVVEPAGDRGTEAEAWASKLRRKWREYGPAEFFRRGLRKTVAGVSLRRRSSVRLKDPRTVAQFRALSYLLTHLDSAAEKRRRVQAARRRSDREILEKFPLHLVPTYPGDAELFSSSGFEAWLPRDLPLVRKSLEEIMEMEP